MTPKMMFSFLIDPELADGLTALKRRDGASKGESIRRALAAYLKKQGVMKTGRKRVVPRKRP